MESQCIFISFIIPAYNCERYLKDCVMSILNQKLSSIEILIVNDGSIDNTVNIAKKLQEEFPHLIKFFNKNNGGAASARNLGLEKSRGDYLIFIDSDDLIFGKDLEKSINIIKNNQIDILISDISLLIENKIKRNENNAKSLIVSKDVLNYISTLHKFPGSCCSKIFSRKFINRIGIRFVEGIVNEDIDFMLKCFKENPVLLHTNYSWYLYRQDVENSVTNIINPKNCIDMFNIFENNLLENKKNTSLNRILCYEYSTLFYYYNRFQNNDKQLLKPYFRKYKYLLKQRSLKEKILYWIYSLLGLDFTASLVSKIYDFKRRKISGITK